MGSVGSVFDGVPGVFGRIPNFLPGATVERVIHGIAQFFRAGPGFAGGEGEDGGGEDEEMEAERFHGQGRVGCWWIHELNPSITLAREPHARHGKKPYRAPSGSGAVPVTWLP